MAKKSTKQIPLPIQVQDTALALALTMGWHSVSMADIALASNIGLGDLLKLYPSKSAVIRGFVDRIDDIMLDGLTMADLDEPVRDRLFDLIMARFDALLPYRDSLIAVSRAQTRDPLGTLCLLMRVRRSLTLMLEGAGLSTSGLRGQLRLKGLALIYANTIRVWVDDDSSDMAKTMAALDQGLARAEKIVTSCQPKSPPQDAGDEAA
jgi:AcrR family transcriptional regulator